MKRMIGLLAASSPLVAIVVPSAVTQDVDRSQLPIPLSPFEGKIGKTCKDSKAAWQSPVAALSV